MKAATASALAVMAYLERLRVAGNRPAGVWLLEPMPGNHDRIDAGFDSGFFAMELPRGEYPSLSPLTGLQVWLYAKNQRTEWVQWAGPLVMQAEPDGLYVTWRGLGNGPADVVIRNPSAGPLDLYELVRLDALQQTPKTDPENQARRFEELVAKAAAEHERGLRKLASAQMAYACATELPSSSNVLAQGGELCADRAPIVQKDAPKNWWEEEE